jgi:hypothetical protein
MPARPVLGRMRFPSAAGCSPKLGQQPRQLVMARMKHPSVRQLFEHWNERRGVRLMPRREDIEPEAIRGVLADTFIVSFAPSFGHPVRVAGTRVCALFGREIKGEPFLEAFTADTRAEMADLIAIMAEESVGIVASASEQAAGADMRTELLLLPLSLDGNSTARFLGALVPADPARRRQTPGLAKLVLGSYRFVGGRRAAGLVPHALAHRRGSRPFVVYEGGQDRNPR